MPAYRAIVEGRNFRLSIDGRSRRLGFYQTVFVQCTDATEVESIAIRQVKDDIELKQMKQMTQNDQADTPMLYLDSFEEIDGSEPLPTAKGRTYYVEKHRWQFWRWRCCGLRIANRWSGRVENKVPSPRSSARRAPLNRQAS